MWWWVDWRKIAVIALAVAVAVVSLYMYFSSKPAPAPTATAVYSVVTRTVEVPSARLEVRDRYCYVHVDVSKMPGVGWGFLYNATTRRPGAGTPSWWRTTRRM
jgi:hypothetical protein